MASIHSTRTEVSKASGEYCLAAVSLIQKIVVKSPAEVAPVDYIVCAHKAIDQEDVAVQLKPAVDPRRTTIVIIQNGVGNEEAFRNQFPQCSILTCVVCLTGPGDTKPETDGSRHGWEQPRLTLE